MMNKEQIKTLCSLEERLQGVLPEDEFQAIKEGYIDKMYGQTDQEVLLHELRYFVSRIEGLLGIYNPVDLFPEEVHDMQEKPGKIINLCITFSYQSSNEHEAPALCLRTIDIGEKHLVKHTGKEWQKS